MGQFQSTRPRGARPCGPVRERLGANVSIHAPARGATPGCAPDRRGCSVSIHAPARGATRVANQFQGAHAEFQSTRPRGARRPRKPVTYWVSRFNPRARAGRDFILDQDATALERFNPRARAGRDDAFSRRMAQTRSFNPRARAGRDAGTSSSAPTSAAFQSTRPRGARRAAGRWRRGPAEQVSIHAPARGATRSRRWRNCSRRSFNPRARAGRDCATVIS